VYLKQEAEMESLASFEVFDTEHDACALMAVVNRTNNPTRENVTRVLDGLIKMSHRAGMVAGDGDGCGVLLDIPRQMWEQKLSELGENGGIAWREDFWVGHVLIKRGTGDADTMRQVVSKLEAVGFKTLYCHRGETDSTSLGPQGQLEEPGFWQIAGVCFADFGAAERDLFRLQLHLEATLPLLFASLSFRTVVYKLRGSPEVLERYFADLRNPRLASVATLGHSRYCTNTVSSFFRV